MERKMLNIGYQRRVLVLLLVALMLGSCGGNEPDTLRSAPASAPTTFDTTKEYVGEDRERSGAGSPDTPEGETGADVSPPGGLTSAPPGQEPPEPVEGSPDAESASRAPPSSPAPTGDLLGDVPYAVPDDPILNRDTAPTIIMMPGTEGDVIGWPASSLTWGDLYEGAVELVLDGWVVEHHGSDEGVEVTVTVLFTLAGNYVISSPGTPPLSFFPESYRGEVIPVSAAYLAPNDQPGAPMYSPVPVDLEWLDPLMWAPVSPGETRDIWMQWIIPGEARVLDISIFGAKYLVFPQDPGAWGSVAGRQTEERQPWVTDGELTPPCEYTCPEFGVGMDVAAIYTDGRPSEDGWSFWLHLDPYPRREEMSNADIRVRHEGQPEEFFPTGDPWEYIEDNEGAVAVDVRMPAREAPLYVSLFLPDGTTLHWKTVAPLRDTLFESAHWVWESSEGHWAEEAAISTADTICWAHWTGRKDPYTLYPEPVEVPGGPPKAVTATMVEWVVERVC